MGKRLALVLGYNDSDGQGKPGCKLRWPRGADPWSQAATATDRPRAWGDILIAPALKK